MSLRYGSVCSGIEAATVAWHPLGWQPQFFSEIEAAPRAVLQHRFPTVPLHGDFTTIREGEYGAIDLLVGGTPCQSFSVAGLRGGLADDRGNLALQYLRLAQRLRPRWLVWENVPGVLSSSGGRDFGAILGGMVELGYGFAYRVLDAQYVRVDGYGRAVPQRRRRVFVVGYLGDWRRAAAVLLERACMRGDPAPGREAGKGIADSLEASLGRRCGQPNCGSREGQLIAACLNGHSEYGADVPTLRAKGGDAAGGSEALLAHCFDARQSDVIQYGNFTGPLDTDGHTMAIAFSCKDHGADATDAGASPTLRAMGHAGSRANAGGQMAVAFMPTESFSPGDCIEVSPTLRVGTGLKDRGEGPAVAQGWSVRRLTPTECERLQGFPDGWTAVPWRGGIMPDGPRYKMLGNSMACNAMRWIGRRIEAVDALEVAPALMAAE